MPANPPVPVYLAQLQRGRAVTRSLYRLSQWTKVMEVRMPAPMYDKLEDMSHEELMVAYNGLARSTQVGLSFYREELWRRDLAALAAILVVAGGSQVDP